MERQQELNLIDELLELKANKSFYLDEQVGRSATRHYASADRYAEEQNHIFRRQPHAVALSTEINEAHDFVRRNIPGLSVLVTRTKDGAVRAFINACRHRGTRLVDDEAGCKRRFTCPYHAWTYSAEGDLIGAPHFDEGFTELEKSQLGLVQLPCTERYGFIWVSPHPDRAFDIDAMMAGLAPDLEGLGIGDMVIAEQTVMDRGANWKILVEGGIEAYHFKVAHRSTIGPYFEDNLSTYQTFGPNMRSILPRVSMGELSQETREKWRLRDHANVLYTLFPTTQMLVQQDHIVWIRSEPLAADRTRLHLSTLVVREDAERTEHWQRNHAITMKTLDEDFVIGESMQSTLTSGANDEMLFGRFEGALTAFNDTVNKALSKATTRP